MIMQAKINNKLCPTKKILIVTKCLRAVRTNNLFTIQLYYYEYYQTHKSKVYRKFVLIKTVDTVKKSGMNVRCNIKAFVVANFLLNKQNMILTIMLFECYILC